MHGTLQVRAVSMDMDRDKWTLLLLLFFPFFFVSFFYMFVFLFILTTPFDLFLPWVSFFGEELDLDLASTLFWFFCSVVLFQDMCCQRQSNSKIPIILKTGRFRG